MFFPIAFQFSSFELITFYNTLTFTHFLKILMFGTLKPPYLRSNWIVDFFVVPYKVFD